MGRSGRKSHSTSKEEEEEEYEVEKIVDKRINKAGEVEYFVKWVGYSSEENTWQTIDSMNCPALIKEFETSHRIASLSPSPKKTLSKRRKHRVTETQEDEKKAVHPASPRSPRKSPCRSPKSTPGAGVSMHPPSTEGTLFEAESNEEESSEEEAAAYYSSPALISNEKLLDDLYGRDWENTVEKVITIFPENRKVHHKSIYLRFRGDENKVLVPLEMAYIRCPQNVLRFYESRLKFPSKNY